MRRYLVPLLFTNNQQGDPAAEYAASVLATSPLRYNKLNEGSGSAIVDSSGNGYTGTYTGVTWDGTLSPVGEPVPFFDGANDYGNLYSAAFGTAFNFDEATVMIWLKPFDASVWTDGVGRTIYHLNRDASNYFRIRKPTTNNAIVLERVAAGTAKNVSLSSFSPVDFTCLAYSVSMSGGGLLAAGESRAYQDGAQVGTTQTSNLAATGSGLLSTQTLLGAFNTSPAVVWHGYLSQFAIWNRPIDNDILALMTV